MFRVGLAVVIQMDSQWKIPDDSPGEALAAELMMSPVSSEGPGRPFNPRSGCVAV